MTDQEKQDQIWTDQDDKDSSLEISNTTSNTINSETGRTENDGAPQTPKTRNNNTSSIENHDIENQSPANTSPTKPPRPAAFTSTSQEILFVLTATMAIAMSSLLIGSVTVTSSRIGHELSMTTAQITWITSSSSLSAGAFLLLFGRLADLFGRRILFIGSLFLFSVFALVSGFARQAITLDVLNGVLGLFNASAVPAAQGLLAVSYGAAEGKRRNYAFACFAAGNPLGFAFGAIFGGVAATVFSWRASFWLIAIVFFVFTGIGAFTIPPDPVKKEPLNWETLKKLDLVGVFCVVFGVGMFSAALSLGDSAPQGWTSAFVLALLVVGVLLMVAFVIWDTWLSEKYALIPMNIWKDRNFSLALIILSLGFLAFTPAVFFYALYLQNVWNFSPILVAVHLLPMFFVGMIVNAIAGFILHRVSNKFLMLLSTICFTAAFVLFAVNRRTTSYWALTFPAQILMVTAADLQFNVCNMLVMTTLPKSQQSIAGGIFQTAVRLTATLGFGVCTAVFNSVQKSQSLSNFWDAETQPYAACFWVSAAYSALSVCFVPFLTLGTQGGDDDKENNDETMEKSKT